MGIHDRKYMTDNKPPLSGGSLPKTFTVKYVILTAIVFLLNEMASNEIYKTCTYFVAAVHDFEVWRIFTAFFTFDPGTSFIGVAIILFVFYSIGNSIENELGTKRYINLLITASAGMALVGLILPETMTVSMSDGTKGLVPVNFGYAGGLLSALFLSYGLFLGKEKMTLLLFFLIPVTLSGYMLIGFTVGIIFLSALALNSTTALPMLGGCFGAYFYINMYMKGKDINLFSWLKPKPKPQQQQNQGRTPAAKMNTHQQNFQLLDEDPEEDMDDVDKYIKEKVDPILEKIATSGMNSLTAKEKKILENAKKKMGK